MNRREAIAALVALPEITRMYTATVAPDDVIVVETTQLLSMAARANMSESLQRIWPGRRIVILSSGMTLKVVAGDV